MKKKILVSLLVLMMCFVITGCDNKSENNSSPNQEENNNNNNQNNNNNNNQNNNQNNNNNNSNTDSLSISENTGKYNYDLPLGLENNYVKATGREIVIRVQTAGSTDQQENGPYYISYNMYVGNDELGLKCVRDAIYHLEGYGVTMLKEFDEEDIGVNYEFFEWDFTSSAHKGKDKDYIAISFPAGTEDKPQASLIITTDGGKLLGEYIVDVIHDITVTGPEVDKYKNHSGDIVFNSIKDGVITYLTPTDAMYKKDVNGKKVLDTTLDEIELEEHSVTMDNNKAIDTKTKNTYKIKGAKGKSSNFGEFRHL